MKKAISNILIFLLVAVVIAYAALFAMGFRPYIIISGSMEPTIHTGSLCFVDSKVPFEEVEKGDIIAFSTSLGDYVTHRAVEITDDAIATKGDANDVSDGFSTTRDNYLGVTEFSVPYLGYAAKYMQQPVGMAMMGVVILAVIALGVIDSIEDKKKREEDADVAAEAAQKTETE